MGKYITRKIAIDYYEDSYFEPIDPDGGEEYRMVRVIIPCRAGEEPEFKQGHLYQKISSEEAQFKLLTSDFIKYATKVSLKNTEETEENDYNKPDR